MVIALLLVIMIGLFFIFRHMQEREKRHEVFEKWLFDSLYSINHNVKLPDDDTRIVKRPAKISSIPKTAKNQIRGMIDDRFNINED